MRPRPIEITDRQGARSRRDFSDRGFLVLAPTVGGTIQKNPAQMSYIGRGKVREKSGQRQDRHLQTYMIRTAVAEKVAAEPATLIEAMVQ
jgi:hypothetical protein